MGRSSVSPTYVKFQDGSVFILTWLVLAVAALWSRFFLKKAPPQFEKTRLVLAVEGAEEAAAVEVEIGDFNFVLPDGSDPPFSVFSSVPVKPFMYIL